MCVLRWHNWPAGLRQLTLIVNLTQPRIIREESQGWIVYIGLDLSMTVRDYLKWIDVWRPNPLWVAPFPRLTCKSEEMKLGTSTQVDMCVLLSLCSWMMCLDPGFCCLDSPSMMDCIAWNCELQQSPISTIFFDRVFYSRNGTETRRQAFPGSGSLGQFHKVRGLGCLTTHGLHLLNPVASITVHSWVLEETSQISIN